MRNWSTEPVYTDAVVGFIVGYLALTLLLHLWILYTEWALEFERNKARIYFEEKDRAERTRGKSTNFLTLEGRANTPSS